MWSHCFGKQQKERKKQKIKSLRHDTTFGKRIENERNHSVSHVARRKSNIHLVLISLNVDRCGLFSFLILCYFSICHFIQLHVCLQYVLSALHFSTIESRQSDKMNRAELRKIKMCVCTIFLELFLHFVCNADR